MKIFEELLDTSFREARLRGVNFGEPYNKSKIARILALPPDPIRMHRPRLSLRALTKIRILLDPKVAL